MSFAKKHNQGKNPFNFELKGDMPFKKPAELVDDNGLDKVYQIKGFYINKHGKFGDEPVIVTDGCLVNAPSHMVNTVKDIMSDSESVHLVNNGEAWFKFYHYENQYGDQYGVEFCDPE